MKRLFVVFLFGIITAAVGFAQNMNDQQTVATVFLKGTEPITVKQFRTALEEAKRMELFQSRGTEPSVQEVSAASRSADLTFRRQVLDGMINQRLVLQAADRDRVTVSDNEINKQIEQLKAVLARNLGRQPTEAEFAQAVRNESGMEVPAFREYLKKQLITQKYLMTKKEDLLNSIKPPTEADITNYYNLHKAEIVRPETVRFSMIQIPYGPDAASKAKAKTLADRLVREIGSDPAKFDEAAINGQSSSAGYQAGDAGYLPRNAEAQQRVGQEFMNTAFSLKQGQVSKLLEGPRAYHIIKVTETYIQKSLALDDVLQLGGDRATVREYIEYALFQQSQQKILNQATQELISELRKGNPFTIVEKNLSL